MKLPRAVEGTDVEPDLAGLGEICVVAAAPSVTPWSVRRERDALREGGVDAAFATVASLGLMTGPAACSAQA